MVQYFIRFYKKIYAIHMHFNRQKGKTIGHKEKCIPFQEDSTTVTSTNVRCQAETPLAEVDGMQHLKVFQSVPCHTPRQIRTCV